MLCSIRKPYGSHTQTILYFCKLSKILVNVVFHTQTIRRPYADRPYYIKVVHTQTIRKPYANHTTGNGYNRNEMEYMCMSYANHTIPYARDSIPYYINIAFADVRSAYANHINPYADHTQVILFHTTQTMLTHTLTIR